MVPGGDATGVVIPCGVRPRLNTGYTGTQRDQLRPRPPDEARISPTAMVPPADWATFQAELALTLAAGALSPQRVRPCQCETLALA